MALLATDLRLDLQIGRQTPETEIDRMAQAATQTFLRAFGKR
jgi:hypothetical protein